MSSAVVRLVFIALALAALSASKAQAQSSQVTEFTVNNRQMDTGGGSGGTASGQGDLDLHITCYGAAYGVHFDDPTSLTLRLYINGQLVNSSYLWGTWEVYNVVSVTVPASTSDRSVSCEAEGPFSVGNASGTILGSGPGSATIKIASFIAQEWVGNPLNIYRIFGGDNRGFSYSGGTSRAETVYDVLNPAVNDGDVLGGPYHGTGLTQEYDIATSLTALPPYGHLTGAAINDWTWDTTLKTRWGMASASGLSCTSPQRLGANSWDATSTHRFTCTAAASDPLIAGAPTLDWSFEFTLTYGRRKIAWQLSGCTDPFPRYEVYLNSNSLLQRSDSGNPDDLFYSCNQSVSASGEVQ